MLKEHVFLFLFACVLSEELRGGRLETLRSTPGPPALNHISASRSDGLQYFIKEHATTHEPKETPPTLSPPANVTAAATCEFQVVATWFYPDDASTSFWLQLCMEGITACQNARAGCHERKFTFDVDPTENVYKFSILASRSTPNEEVNSTAVAVDVTTFPDIPLMDSTAVSGGSASSLRVTWTTEWKYTVRFSVCSVQEMKRHCRDYSASGLQLTYTITGLNASTLYQVDTRAQVTRYGLTCVGPVFEQDVSTFAFDIGPVRNLKHGVFNVTFMAITWQEPKGSSNITGYAINCKVKGGSQSTSAQLPRSQEVNATLDLKLQLANFTCTANAFAETPNGREDGIPTTFDVVTDGIEVPRDVILVNATRTTLTYSWLADPTAGRYRITVKTKAPNQALADVTENPLANPDGTFVKHTVFGLLPGTFYEISIQNCAAYCGLPKIVSDTTEVSAPTQVQHLTSKLEGYLNITLMWIRPEAPNGPIDGYLIKISNEDNNRTEEQHVGGNSLSYSVTLWELFSYFKASVSPYNIDHYRNVTVFGLNKSTMFATLGEGPFPPSPEVVSINERRALIFWKVPHDRRYDISRFLVGFNDSGHFFTPDNHCWLEGLMPFQHYAVNVSSCTTKDCGETRAVSFRTDAGFPSFPENLTVDSRNTTSLLLKWHRPQIPNGPINGYKVTWSDGIKTYQSVASDQSFRCTHLKPGTLYKISVYAFNDGHRETKYSPPTIVEAATECDGNLSGNTSTLALAVVLTVSCLIIVGGAVFIVFKRRKQKRCASFEEFNCQPLVGEETPPAPSKNILNCLSSSV